MRDIKEKCAHVPLDYIKEHEKARNSKECDISYELPDGSTVSLNEERFSCTEFLFNPEANGFELGFNRLDEVICETISQIDEKDLNRLLQSINISGGSALLNGLVDRLESDIKRYVGLGKKVNVISNDHKKESVLGGAAVFATLAIFDSVSVQKYEYDETGKQIINQRFY